MRIPLRPLAAALAATALLSRPGRADEAAPAFLPPDATLSHEAAVPEMPVLDAERVEARMDVRVDARTMNPRVAEPVVLDCSKRQRATPCRPAPAGWETGWEAAMGMPHLVHPSDFELYRNYDRFANPHYEIREYIWHTPEDFVTPYGESYDQGVAHIPLWSRNVIRLGRAQFFPFGQVEGVYHSNYFQDSDDELEVWEVATTAGFLGEYMFPGGTTNLKFGGRATYHVYDAEDDELDDEWTWVAGAAIEHRFGCWLTVDAGFEFERALCNVNRSTTLFRRDGKDHDHEHDEDHDVPFDGHHDGKKDGKDGHDHDHVKDGHVDRHRDRFIEEKDIWTFFGNVRWDRPFCLCDLRLEAGARYTVVEETTGVEGADYEELSAYGRLSYALVRHESFLYGQYAYEERDAEEPSADLEAAHEVTVGVNGVIPWFTRTRRLVGDAHVGVRFEEYSGGSFDDDDDVEAFVAGVELVYRAGPTTSAYVAYERTHAFSTVANYNELDQVDVGITHNFHEDLLARAAASWIRLAPDDGDDDSHRLTVGVGVRWVVMRWLDLTLDYEYSHRFEGAGFDEAESHRVALGASIYLR
jgi:hypothetical protein